MSFTKGSNWFSLALWFLVLFLLVLLFINDPGEAVPKTPIFTAFPDQKSYFYVFLKTFLERASFWIEELSLPLHLSPEEQYFLLIGEFPEEEVENLLTKLNSPPALTFYLNCKPPDFPHRKVILKTDWSKASQEIGNFFKKYNVERIFLIGKETSSHYNLHANIQKELKKPIIFMESNVKSSSKDAYFKKRSAFVFTSLLAFKDFSALSNFSPELVVLLESPPEALYLLWEGKVQAALELSPSLFAQKIQEIIRSFESNGYLPKEPILIPPLLITRSNLKEADAAEVFYRCPLCH